MFMKSGVYVKLFVLLLSSVLLFTECLVSLFHFNICVYHGHAVGAFLIHVIQHCLHCHDRSIYNNLND